MKHKHADLIHAWADGAEIQLKAIDGWRDIQRPHWHDNNDYRIKPKPDVVLLGAVLETGEAGCFTTYASHEDSSFPDNLRLTFDGETGKLKSAEVL
jgi:hypothetical protein